MTISTCSYAGEYSTISGAVSGQSLRFTSSAAGDNITIRSGSPTGPVVGFGTTPLTVANNFTGTLYAHWNLAGCGTQSTCRTTTVQCLSCLPCQNTSQFPSTAVSLNPTNTTGAAQTITTCNFAGDYFALTNVLSGKSYTLTSSVSTDFFTVRVGSAGGTVLVSGVQPLVVNTTSTSDLYVHLNTNSSCGTSSSCRITAVQCTNCIGAPSCTALPSSPTNGQTNICPSATQTLSWPAVTLATDYDVYFGTSTTPGFYANTSSTSIVVNTPSNGTYYWQVRPRNASGVASGCTVWSFTKIDITAPTITCPASVVANNNPATACSAVVTYGSISAVDNCAAPSITLIGGLNSGSTFPVGVTTITYRATDPSNNSSTCSFTVTVNDVTLPSITCPANIVKNNDPGLCGAVTTYATPAASDNCSLAAGSPSLTSGQLSGSLFPVGVTTNVWQAKDASNNTRTCSFTVTVNDNEKPTISCPDDILRGNDYGFCSANLPYLGSPTFHDNCFVNTVSNNSPVNFPVGSTTVTWTVKDNYNNTASCVQNVTIEDREYPVLTCPANIQVKTDEGDCVATVSYAATATDNCAGLVVEYDNDHAASFDIGLTNVGVTATDASGNAVNCYFQISVGTRTEICNGFDDDCDGLSDEAEDWARIAKRLAADGANLDEYGVSVDIDGDYAIVGSNQKNASGQSVGAAYILFRDKNGPNAWGQLAKLNAPDLLPGDNFGASVAISGGVAAVGSPLDDDQIGNEGSVLIFYQNPTNPSEWNFLKKVTVLDTDAGDNLGASVALDGDRLIAGANLDDEKGSNAGAAYVFYRNQGGADNWGQVSKLTATTGNASDNFGVSVAIAGDYAVVGANGVDGLLQDVGAAYVFGRNQFGADAWGQVAKLQSTTPGQNDNFGASVAISGSWALVGADRNDRKGTDAGAVFAFYKNQNGINNSWGQRNILLDNNGKAGDRFGSSVALDAEYAVVGAKGDDDQFGDDSGAGFLFLNQDNGWVLVGTLEDGGGQTGDALGSAAAISGRTAIMGAPLDDAPGSNAGSAIVFGGLCNDGSPQERTAPVAENSASVRCFPVPFSSILNIEVKGMKTTDAQVTILNTLGQTVANLYNGAIDGDMVFHWRPTEAASGVYFLRVSADQTLLTQTIVLER